jgi:hypothetical protein
MSDSDDLHDVTQPPISEELAEQLLSGSTIGVGSTPSAAQLGDLFAAVRAPGDPSELNNMDTVVSAFQGAVVTSAAGQTTARTRPMIKKLLTGKALATLGAITLVSAGAAAAATGTVPSPFSSDKAKEVTAEHVPEKAFDAVGKHADGTDDDADESTEATETTEAADESTEATEATTEDATEATTDDTTDGQGPDATGPAKYGLCTAFAAHAEHGDDADDADDADATPTESTEVPVPFQNLADAAAAAGQTVEEFCADATPGKSESAPGQGDESPSATAPGRVGDGPSATAPGHSDDNPSATAPGRTDDTSVTAPAAGSDDNPSATAPGQADNPSVTAPAGGSDDNPSATAPGHSDDHGSGHGDNP